MSVNALIIVDYKSFFFYPFSLANVTVDLNRQRKSWWKLTVIISGSTWPFLPSSPDPVVKISVTANLAVVKERFQACIKSLSIWETSKSLLGNIFSISFFIIHLQPFQCHFLANKSYFSSFTLKKKAFNLRNSGLTSLRLKSWATLFSNWSVLEELASWKYHASVLWAALGPTLCPIILVSAWETFLVTWQGWHWHWAALGKKAAGRAGGGLSDGENETGSGGGSP